MLLPVLEPERRKSHIDCIDPNHPLLPIAIQCLNYNERDRPSAQQLCHQLAALKEAQIEANEQDNEHIITEFQQTLTQIDTRIREQEETISAKEREQPRPKQQPKRSKVSNTVADTIKLNWRQCPEAPRGMTRGSATVNGSMAYFNHCDSTTVHVYNSDRNVWSQMPECPQKYYFTLAVVKGLVTAIGGDWYAFPTNTLISFIGESRKRKLFQHFPPMSTKRCDTTVVCSGK